MTAADGATTQTYTVSFDYLPSAGPTAPANDAADVVSIYSDAYTDITTDYNPNWGQSGSAKYYL